MALSFKAEGNWIITEIQPPPGKQRRGLTAKILPQQFLQSGAVVESILDAVASDGQRRGEVSALQLKVDATADEACIVAVRHASGALTFHRPVETVARRRGTASSIELLFHVPVRAQSARRGLFSKAVKVAIIKIAGTAANKAAALAVPRIALA